MPSETEIQNLLKLKRYEQPTQQYYEQFLRDFQHRQRAELIRKPLLEIAFHRIQAFFSEPLFSQLAYAGATAAVLLVAGVASAKIMGTGNGGSNTSVALANVAPARHSVPLQSSMGLVGSQIRLADWTTLPNQPVSGRAPSLNPHYVIDSRPVSYEPPSSF